MRRSRVGAVILVAVAAAVGGCGGDDEGGGLSRAELNDRTGAICADASKKTDAIAEPQDIADASQATTFLQEVYDVANEADGKLRELEPAEDAKADYDAFLASFAKSRDFFKGVLDKAKAKDPSGLADLQRESESGTLGKEIDDAARKAGLTKCAEQD